MIASPDHSQSGAKDRNQGQLFSADVPAFRRLERSVHDGGLNSQVDCRFIRHEHRDFVDELLEDLRRSVPVPQYGQLVLNQRMPDYCQRREFKYLFDHDRVSTCVGTKAKAPADAGPAPE